jgi:glucoamylase
MPLVWAHAEYVKLCRSLRDGRVFDMPPQAVRRYLVERRTSRHTLWRPNQKCRALVAGKTLRIETLAPAVIHWSANGSARVREAKTRPTGLGVYAADLPTQAATPGERIGFTLSPRDGGGAEEEYWVAVAKGGSS